MFVHLTILLLISAITSSLGERQLGSWITAGCDLLPGDCLYAPNTEAEAKAKACFQTDGNFGVYLNGAPIWQTNTPGKGGVKVSIQSDNNVVMYKADGTVLWRTSTDRRGFRSAKLTLSADGELLLQDAVGAPLWSSKKGALPRAANIGDALMAGEYMVAGEALVSKNGQFRAVVQGDGNFVVYNAANAPIFNAGTAGAGPNCRLVLQADNNLVLFNAASVATDSPVWQNGCAYRGKGLSRLVMQDDGNLVQIDANSKPIWSSKSGALPAGNLGNLLRVDQYMVAGDQLTSTNGAWRTILQGDGNFVVYGTDNKPAWNSGTFKTGAAARLIMQGDKNLVLYDRPGGAAAWHTQTFNKGAGAPALVMKDNGNLVLYTNGVPLWATKGLEAGDAFVQPPLPALPALPAIADAQCSFDRFQKTQPKPVDGGGNGGHQGGGNAAAPHKPVKGDRQIGSYLTGSCDLRPGDCLHSPNSAQSAAKACFQKDSNFVVYVNNAAVWSTNTMNQGGVKISLQNDNNLVMYEADGAMIWHTQTYGRGKAPGKLQLQPDGELILQDANAKPLWSSMKGPVPIPNLGDTMNTDRSMIAGEGLYSKNGQFRAVLQTDGNFVVYDAANKATFNTQTFNAGGNVRLVLQADNNLALVNAAGAVVWQNSAGYRGSCPSKLIMQDDGNLVEYDSNNKAVWSSMHGVAPQGNLGNLLRVNQFMVAADQLTSTNGAWRAVLQGDGNFVVYGTDNKPAWNSGTFKTGAAVRLIMQGDKNLVIYDRPGGNAAWHTQTWNKGSGTPALVMKDNGNLVLYTNGVPLWATKSLEAGDTFTEPALRACPMQTLPVTKCRWERLGGGENGGAHGGQGGDGDEDGHGADEGNAVGDGKGKGQGAAGQGNGGKDGQHGGGKPNKDWTDGSFEFSTEDAGKHWRPHYHGGRGYGQWRPQGRRDESNEGGGNNGGKQGGRGNHHGHKAEGCSLFHEDGQRPVKKHDKEQANDKDEAKHREETKVGLAADEIKREKRLSIDRR